MNWRIKVVIPSLLISFVFSFLLYVLLEFRGIYPLWFSMSLSILIFFSAFIGSFYVLSEFKKFDTCLSRLFFENTVWFIPIIIVWFITLVIGHIFDSPLLTNILFWPSLVVIFFINLYFLKKELSKHFLSIAILCSLVFLPFLMYLCYFAITYQPVAYQEVNVMGKTWGLIIMATGFSLNNIFLFPLLRIWGNKKKKFYKYDSDIIYEDGMSYWDKR